MLVVLSPAKKLDFDVDIGRVTTTKPGLRADTSELIEVARDLSADDLKRLMGISDALATLNQARFQAFASKDGKPEQARPAAYAFRGDTYVGLGVDDFEPDDLEFAQAHLRILSGLYGLLRPLDRIQPYRLEMGTKLVTGRGKTLYDFWGDKLAKALDRQAKSIGARALINCASNEYFTAARADSLSVPTITPVFKEVRNGQAKIVSFSAKRARGMMARFIIKHRLTDPADLRGFSEAGYEYQPSQSDEHQLLFLRTKPA